MICMSMICFSIVESDKSDKVLIQYLSRIMFLVFLFFGPRTGLFSVNLMTEKVEEQKTENSRNFGLYDFLGSVTATYNTENQRRQQFDV